MTIPDRLRRCALSLENCTKDKVVYIIEDLRIIMRDLQRQDLLDTITDKQLQDLLNTMTEQQLQVTLDKLR